MSCLKNLFFLQAPTLPVVSRSSWSGSKCNTSYRYKPVWFRPTASHLLIILSWSQVYLPSCMFVVVSWVSFMIKPEVVPGRMALLVTLFLVLINIFNSVR